MIHRHLNEGFESTIEAVEDVLDRGTISDWRELYAKIVKNPFGEEAEAVKIVITNRHIYGTSVIWGMLLDKLCSSVKEPPSD
ncbi:hypothetical protein [Syntrophorhabdus aromaticivorans]|uniref:Uncharacterized protein n=1 Tax=Syntrophorhabdus aromaticivorans TaxID=328301 RepID=A0A351U3Z9_9BACT|nr:hypothetical protein [Syntrophorhabdus aromaticivorans]NLW33966.1 hypothetical protein [Syntrophorhabdus aromaticivorans]HBA54680.1 hypothetical protein [Syntrophorhabdus aromaticivorans]